MNEIIIVLTYAAIIGGVPQSITVQQPDMDTCLERADELMLMDEMVGPAVDGQTSVLEVGERKASCTTMTVAELFDAE